MAVPERLGRLRRVRPLGAGGFATVWLYRDDELRSHVAVKALADNWAQRLDIRERFLEEARILRAADSDHVVRVHDIGESDGTPWFVMTYADRGSLDRALTGTPLPPAAVLPVVRQAAAGLAVLHARGVVHRDVKPQNLLLRSPGTPSPDDGPLPSGMDVEELADSRLMVADLGVAKALVHASGLTQVVGTPAYMAPEQASGTGIDPRADVHALGAVTYHLLTGRRLREGGLSTLAAGAPPVAPSMLTALPAGVDEVVLRAVEARPEDRWPDVTTYADALADALAGTRPAVRPRVAPAPSAAAAPSASAVEARTRPAVAVLLVLLVLLGTGAVSFAVVALLR